MGGAPEEDPVPGPSGFRRETILSESDTSSDEEPVPGPSGLRRENIQSQRKRNLSSSSSDSTNSNSSFIQASESNLIQNNVDPNTENPFEEGQIIYRDEIANLNLKIQKIRHQRETNYLDDHLFEISVTENRRTRSPPFIFSLLMVFQLALLEILASLGQFYNQDNNHQMYITVIDDSINHGLNTGNYNVRTNPSKVTDRVLSMLYNFLTSHMSLRLNQSFRFNIKVLSVRHARDRTQTGGFNPHILNGAFSIKKKNYLFFLPEGFEGYEKVFSKNCLLLSIILGHYLNKSLEISGKNYCTIFKKFSDINSTKREKKMEAGKAILEEIARVCKDNEIINEIGPHSLEELAPKLSKYFNCQIIVFNNLIADKVSYCYPQIFDDTKGAIFLFQEIFGNGESHISLIRKIKSFQRFNFSFCLYCSKVYKSRSQIFQLHNCKKRKICESCNRYIKKESTYLNKTNIINYCIKGEDSFNCEKCDKKMTNAACKKFHNCSEFTCEKCNCNVKRRLFRSLEETKKNHKCEVKFCMICKSPTVNEHLCKLKKSEIDQFQPAIGFLNFQFVNNQNATCYECFQNKQSLRLFYELEWDKFLKLDSKNEELKKSYLCGNHQDRIMTEENCVNLAILKIETEKRGDFETFVFNDSELNELNNIKINLEKISYCEIPINRNKRPKKFGQPMNATSIFQQNLENLKYLTTKSPVENLILKLLEFQNTTILCFGVEHLLFIYKCFLDHGLECKPLSIGQNILLLELEYFGLRFINLQNYFKVQLNELIDLFDLDVKKLYFPEVLNCRENYQLISLSPSEIPVEFYYSFNDNLKEKENKKKFVKENFEKFEEWNFQQKLLDYSIYQTKVIMSASLKFISNTLEFQQLLRNNNFKKGLVSPSLTLPFARNFSTISGFIYNIFKMYFIDPDCKLFIVKNEYPKKIQSSKEEMEYAAFMASIFPEKTFNNVFSAKCERNFKRAIADIFCKEDNTAYFFNECICHGHDPSICPITFKKKNKTFFGRNFEDLRKEFFEKMTYVTTNFENIKIKIIWQCEWRLMKKNDFLVKDFLKNCYIPWPSHHISPREAVRGARIESFALRWIQNENEDERMFYLDCSSLYPYMG